METKVWFTSFKSNDLDLVGLSLLENAAALEEIGKCQRFVRSQS
jgi:hypothetical protein